MDNNEEIKETEKISISKLNECIEENIINMSPSVDYNFLEEASKIMFQGINITNEKQIVPIVLFNREKAISIVLKFFESLENKVWYSQVKNILLGQDKNIGINIFNSKDIDPLEKDENGFYKYSDYSSLECKQNNIKSLIKIMLKEEFQDVYEHIEKDKITLEDIYNITHEISHTFDLGNNEKSRELSSLFVEVTPSCFENMLSEYLIRKNIINERIINKIEQRTTVDSIRDARTVWAKINLVKLKEREGRLNKENIKKMLEENNISDVSHVRSILSDILACNSNIDFQARYMVAELTAHQYKKMYKSNRREATERLKIHCEKMMNGNSSQDDVKLIGYPINEKEVLKVVNDIRDEKNR